ncbi:type 2 periplasmic-binding domain-containing protein [Dickeya solani]|uniref:LysR substrate-binding domain-containing protein n=2 Tax=Pectobacteriaceae TaxID=1903410 RepID=A0AAX4EV17_9GAMM|nr:hypothetical protein [Dickeya solani]WOA51056.1 hypothetical protein RXA29_14040 [Dickeya solani]
MIMLVAAGYGIGIGLASQIALYNHPNVIIREAADNIPSTATFVVTAERERSAELVRFINRAIAIGEMPTLPHAPPTRTL